jgi:uncharacterized protein (TIGR00725 family)
MRSEAFDRESRRLDANLPQLPRIAVLGSTSFSHPNSAAVCKGLGVTLAALGAITLLTGGMGGVGDTVSKSFHEAQAAEGLAGQVVHILPFGHQARDFGSTHFAGSTLAHRREVLARLASVYIVVEGGAGTAEEVAIARARGSCIIPVGSSGGVAAKLYRAQNAPMPNVGEVWAVLGSAEASAPELARAVAEIASRALATPCAD